MIIGGQAALLYREPRFTNDIDITLGVGIEDSDILIQLCHELDFKILVDNHLDFLSQTMVLPVIDQISNFRIDFIFSFTQYERNAIERANIVNIDGSDVCFCSLEDIIILKVFAGRPRDIDDVKTIIRKNPDFDKKLVIEDLNVLGNAVDVDLVRRFTEL